MTVASDTFSANLKEALEHSHSDQKPHTGGGRDRREQGQDGRHDDAHTKHPLPSDPLGQPPTGNLGDKIAIEERR